MTEAFPSPAAAVKAAVPAASANEDRQDLSGLDRHCCRDSAAEAARRIVLPATGAVADALVSPRTVCSDGDLRYAGRHAKLLFAAGKMERLFGRLPEAQPRAG